MKRPNIEFTYTDEQRAFLAAHDHGRGVFAYWEKADDGLMCFADCAECGERHPEPVSYTEKP